MANRQPAKVRKVIVVGLDGVEPALVDAQLAGGELPNLARLRDTGGYARVATTYPAQTPVAWSTFATGVNPGGHGVFDFLRRDPRTYLPSLALNRYEQKNAFTPPKAVNLRGGTPLWTILSEAGLPSIVLRCPCTFPPDALLGRLLAGVGVPDLRGGLGTSTFFTSASDVCAEKSEKVVHIFPDREGVIHSHVIGPRNPRTGEDLTFPFVLELQRSARRATLCSEGRPAVLDLHEGQWSDWLHVRFRAGLFQSVHGMVRFLLVRIAPTFELYASPVNFEPSAPPFPISSPAAYAGELAERLGPYHTAGMAEEYEGLINGRFDESAFLEQCSGVLREREQMMLYELDRFERGLFFCLFDTPDRLQHMFWRFRVPDHPANCNGVDPQMRGVIEEHYRTCDDIVGKVLAYLDDETLLIVLSDHGMNTFRRGLHLNTWLFEHGWLTLRKGVRPGPETGEFFQNVDWSRTKAYAFGLGGIYLNLIGREGQGIVDPAEADSIKATIADQLALLVDPACGELAVRSVAARERLYRGPYLLEAPDLLVNFAAGYRASWATPLGGTPAGLFEDNVKRWGGDHVIDAALTPGVLLMNRPFRSRTADLVDLAPTILAALGVPPGKEMTGQCLLR